MSFSIVDTTFVSIPSSSTSDPSYWDVRIRVDGDHTVHTVSVPLSALPLVEKLVPVEVRSPGLCWQKIALFKALLPADDHMTAARLLATGNTPDGHLLATTLEWISWSVQPDGDIHVEDVLYPDQQKQVVLRALLKSAHALRQPEKILRYQREVDRYEALRPPSEFLAFLATVKDRLVSAPLDLSLYADTSLATIALAPYVREHLQAYNRNARNVPFAIPPKHKALLAEVGIESGTQVAPPGRHAALTALEYNTLREMSDLAHRLSQAGVDYGTMNLRQSKLDTWKLKPSYMYNPVMDHKDFYRYSLVDGPSALSLDVPRVLFMHDTLPLLSASAVGSIFDERPNLQVLVASAVLPYETLDRAESAYSSLYGLDYHSDSQGVDSYTYIVEGDISGSYTHPIMSREWLRSHTLITPSNECLHVALQNYTLGHTLIIISRSQILPRSFNYMGLGAITTVHWHAMPHLPTASRVTTRAALDVARGYSRRNDVVSPGDLHMRLAAHYSTRGMPLSIAHADAAVAQAMFERIVGMHGAHNVHDIFVLLPMYLLRLPLAPPLLVLHTLLTRSFTAFSMPEAYRVKLRPYASATGDQLYLQRQHGLCPAHAPVWWLPKAKITPKYLWLLFAHLSAMFSGVLVGKLLFIDLGWQILGPGVHTAFDVLMGAWHQMDFTVGRFLILLIGWYFMCVLEIFVFHFSEAVQSFKRAIPRRYSNVSLSHRLVATVFGLPNSWTNSNGGHGPFTHVAVTGTLWALASPTSFVHPYFTAGSVKLVLGLVFWFLALVELGILHFGTRHAPVWQRPWHPEAAPIIPTDPSSTPTPPAPQINVVMPDAPIITVGTPPPPPRHLLLNVPAAGQVAAPVVAQPVPVILAPANPAPVPPNYRIPHQGLAHAQYQNIALNLPIPNVGPALADMCVWDTIGRMLGLPPRTVLHIFVAHHPGPQYQYLLTGPPEYQHAAEALRFWPAGMTLRVVDAARCAVDVSLTLMEQTAGVDWPGAFALIIIPVDNTWHIEHGHPQIVSTANTFAPQFNARISWTQARFRPIDLPVLVPLGYNHLYDRLNGVAPNPSALPLGGNPVRALPAYVPLPATQVVAHQFMYTLTQADLDHAALLSTDLKMFNEELRARQINPESASIQLHHSIKFSSFKTYEMYSLHGVGGAGKSHWIKQMIPIWTAAGRKIRFHTWKQSLRAQLMGAFQPAMRAVNAYMDEKTFCSGYTPLFQHSQDVMVFDDAGLLPEAFLKAFMCFNEAVQTIVCTHDATQLLGTFAKGDSCVRHTEKTSQFLCRHDPNWATVNYRWSIEVCQLLGIPRAFVPGNSVLHGGIGIVSSPPEGIPLFAASPRFVESLANSNYDAAAFIDAQGLDFPASDIAIDCGSLTQSAGNGVLAMILGRCGGSVWLVVPKDVVQPGHVYAPKFANSDILNAILAVSARANKPFLVGADDPEHLIARAFQAHISRQVNPGRRNAMALPGPSQPVASYDPIRHDRHMPSQNLTALPAVEVTARLSDAMADQRMPELTYAMFNEQATSGSNNQPKDVASLLRHRDIVDPEMFGKPVPTAKAERPKFTQEVTLDTITGVAPLLDDISREQPVGHGMETHQVLEDGSRRGLTHSAKDLASAVMTEEIRLDHPAAQVTASDHTRARQLVKNLAQFVGIPAQAAPLDEALFARCVSERLRSWSNKRSLQEIRTALMLRDPEQNTFFSEIFFKSQRVKKLGVATADAKKGQTVLDTAQLELFEQSVWVLYCQLMLNRLKHRNVYLHNGQTPMMASAWYESHWDKSKPNTANDVTGWDTGVDEACSLALAEVYRRFGMPEVNVAAMLDKRLNSRTYRGPLPAMQRSGDPYTWLANTLVNIMYTPKAFSIPRGTPVGFSGDDFIANGVFTVKDLPGFTFVNKPLNGQLLEFCGYMYGGPTLHISPRVILHRGLLALEDGRRDQAFWDSYQDSIFEAQPQDGIPNLDLGTAVAVNQMARSQIPGLAPPDPGLPTFPLLDAADAVQVHMLHVKTTSGYLHMKSRRIIDPAIKNARRTRRTRARAGRSPVDPTLPGVSGGIPIRSSPIAVADQPVAKRRRTRKRSTLKLTVAGSWDDVDTHHHPA
uniref:Polyprotein n=1 Tax=Deltaflexiviridae sp. TaxID=2809074 RepID=A0A9E9C2H9_9VIRU|nr:MAG: polyprotein [Deltaflexiviridae sp.]